MRILKILEFLFLGRGGYLKISRIVWFAYMRKGALWFDLNFVPLTHPSLWQAPWHTRVDVCQPTRYCLYLCDEAIMWLRHAIYFFPIYLSSLCHWTQQDYFQEKERKKLPHLIWLNIQQLAGRRPLVSGWFEWLF